jgi:hypothetical protein
VDWIHLAHGRDQGWVLVKMVMNFWVPQKRVLFTFTTMGTLNLTSVSCLAFLQVSVPHTWFQELTDQFSVCYFRTSKVCSSAQEV